MGKCLEIVLGTLSPFATKADAIAIPLAIVGWALIPALAGSLLAIILDEG